MSITKRGRGRWLVRISPYPSKTLPTRAAAEAYELDLKLRKGMGDLYREKPATFGTALDGFLARRKATGRLRPKGVEHLDRSAVFLRSSFGSQLMQSLRRASVEDQFAARAAEHPVSANNELQSFKRVLLAEQERGQHFEAALLSIPPVRHESREGLALTMEQVLEWASWAPEYIRRIFPFAATTAMRASELFAMTDAWLDLDQRRLTVPKAVNKSRKEKPIDLSAGETALLREQLLARGYRGGDARDRERLETAPSRATSGQAIGNEFARVQGGSLGAADRLVFPKRMGGQWTPGRFREKVWLRAVLAAGLGRMVEDEDGKPHYEGARFHDLRHTASSLMCSAGMQPEIVAERRGDADGGMLVLKRYRHLYPSEVANAVTALDAMLAEKGEQEAREA